MTARTPDVSCVAAISDGTGGAAMRVKPARSRPAADWNAKLRPDMQPRVVTDRRRGDRLLLPTPLLVAAEVLAVPAGRTLTMSQLRARLALRHDADRTCPLMTGMFAKIIAGAVADDLDHQRTERWPIWRLVADDGCISRDWPLDALYRATRLRGEGVKLGRKGDHWQVLEPGIAA